MANYYTLQSGFIALTDRGLFKDVAEQTSFRQQVLNQAMDLSRTEYYFSPSVTQLVKSFTSDYKVINSFEFKDKLLAAAFSSFSTTSIKSWLAAQKNSIFFGDLQKAYLLETVNFVCGKNRMISPVQWSKMLEASAVSRNSSFDYESLFAKNHLPHPLPDSIHDFIHMWIKQDKGYEDLLISLWLIFGRRSIKQTLNYPVNYGHSESSSPGAVANVVAGV